MSAGIEPLLSGAPDSLAQLSFLEAVWRAVIWRVFVAAQALALVWALLLYLEARGPQAQPHVLHTFLISRAFAALFLMLAALAADEAIRRGFRMWRVYPVALLAGSAAGAIAQWYARSWLGVIDFPPNAGLPLPRSSSRPTLPPSAGLRYWLISTARARSACWPGCALPSSNACGSSNV